MVVDLTDAEHQAAEGLFKHLFDLARQRNQTVNFGNVGIYPPDTNRIVASTALVEVSIDTSSIVGGLAGADFAYKLSMVRNSNRELIAECSVNLSDHDGGVNAFNTLYDEYCKTKHARVDSIILIP